jgi:hypothetical protein
MTIIFSISYKYKTIPYPNKMAFDKISNDIIIHLSQFLNYNEAFSNGLSLTSHNINNALRETPKIIIRKIRLQEKIIYSILYLANRSPFAIMKFREIKSVPELKNYNYFSIKYDTYPHLDESYNEILLCAIQKNREHKKHLEKIKRLHN